MKREIITTNDGSSSLFVPELDETYHSTFGAINEGLHVFIEKGFKAKLNGADLNILEVGFGTGLNALLTVINCSGQNVNVHYTGIEKYPISPEESQVINYGEKLNAQKEFQQLHDAPWETNCEITPQFTLLKQQMDLVKDPLAGDFDLVYFDAFAPNKQQSMWTLEVFEKIYTQMKPGALLVTYCCQGQVKRTMKAVGFTVNKTDGPPGKREMLVATKF
jgi:tRNA U34 5-methylaminomethyl-2-thiouridine-forming methyltransferase MnmC